METVLQTELPGLTLQNRGKVRDIYEVGAHLLLVATDRLSAFDVILPDPIPGKGAVLTALSNFWFARTRDIVENHIHDARPWVSEPGNATYQKLTGRAVLVKRAEPILVEAVVRGYLAGSGLVEYQASGTVCGIRLPAGLQNSSKLPEPIFTPATKAPEGEHDENISFAEACNRIGKELATRIRDASLARCRRFTRAAGMQWQVG